MSLLSVMAQTEIETGYPGGPKWEAQLRDHVQEHNPKLVKSLGGSLQDYLTVTVADALNKTVTLTNHGMAPMEAEFQARREMYPRGEDDAEDDRQMNQSTIPQETGDTTTRILPAVG